MQKEAALRQAQATLDQALAQAKITAEQDKTDLADASFTVERARLEASKQDIVSRLQGEISQIDLRRLAEQKLKVQQATVALHATSDQLAHRLPHPPPRPGHSPTSTSPNRASPRWNSSRPIAGFLVFQSNYSQGWMNAKPFKVGDNVYAGMVLAEMPDLTTLQMDAKVEEIDRGRIAASQEVKVRVDSLPELTLNANIKQISLLAEASNEFPPTRSFRAYAAIAKPDPRLRPGMNGGMDIIDQPHPQRHQHPGQSALHPRRQALVYVADTGRYRPVGWSPGAQPRRNRRLRHPRRRHGHAGRPRKEGGKQ